LNYARDTTAEAEAADILAINPRRRWSGAGHPPAWTPASRGEPCWIASTHGISAALSSSTTASGASCAQASLACVVPCARCAVRAASTAASGPGRRDAHANRPTTATAVTPTRVAMTADCRRITIGASMSHHCRRRRPHRRPCASF